MSRRWISIILLLLAEAAILIQGCAVAVVGAGAAGTVAYIKGDLEAVEARNLSTVYTAAKKAVKELGFAVTEDKKDALSATIVARDIDDKKITIKLKATTEATTKLSIRVGVFGNETTATLIYRRIQEKLK